MEAGCIWGSGGLTNWVRAHRSPSCFLYVKVARNLGLTAIGGETRQLDVQETSAVRTRFHSLLLCVSVSETDCANPESATLKT